MAVVVSLNKVGHASAFDLPQYFNLENLVYWQEQIIC